MFLLQHPGQNPHNCWTANSTGFLRIHSCNINHLTLPNTQLSWIKAIHYKPDDHQKKVLYLFTILIVSHSIKSSKFTDPATIQEKVYTLDLNAREGSGCSITALMGTVKFLHPCRDLYLISTKCNKKVQIILLLMLVRGLVDALILTVTHSHPYLSL